MAHEKLEDATIEDLEQRFKNDGHKPQLAHGLAVAAKDVHFQGRATDFLLDEFHERKLRFLLSFLGKYDERTLAEEIYIEVVEQLLGNSQLLSVTGEQPYPLQRLVDFLGQYPQLGLRGKVRDFLYTISGKCLAAWTEAGWASFLSSELPALAALSWGSLTEALLRYQMFDELGLLVENKVYEAIPALFEAVVEQVGKENASCVEDLVRLRWWGEEDLYVAQRIVKAFLLVGSDARILRLLFDLAQAHIDEHGKPYELPEATVDDGEWHHL